MPNLLVSCIESPLYRTAGLGVERLRAAGRLLQGGAPREEAVPVIGDALRNHSQRTVELPSQGASALAAPARSSVKPRQLVGQPAAVVERRGGMLIHGAIIAREFGIPCVNGIVDAMNLLDDGDFVTVDGYLGIVTVGPPEFDVELEVTSDGKN